MVQFFLLVPEDEHHTPAIAISISFRLISSSVGGLEIIVGTAKSKLAVPSDWMSISQCAYLANKNEKK